MTRDAQIAQALGIPLPITFNNVVEYMREMQLGFAPGTQYSYSGFGYDLLGLVIEAVTGLDYESYILREVLGPIGASRTRRGHSLLAQRIPGEVTYEHLVPAFTGGTPPMAPSVMGSGTLVPAPYGAFNMRAPGSAAALVASAPELARFAVAFDNPASSPLLSATTIQTMWSRDPTLWPGTTGSWYGMGWNVNSSGHQWHTGSLPGTLTYMRRTPNGVNYVALFNQRPPTSQLWRFEVPINTAARTTTTWPTHDLFGSRGAFPTFHQGCAGSAGEPGIRQLSGTLPRLGGALGIELTNLPTGGINLPFIALDGVPPTPIPLGSLAPGCDLLGTWTITQPMQNVGGRAQLTLPIAPTFTGLVGARLYVQGAVTDPVSQLGVIFTRGADVLIGQ